MDVSAFEGKLFGPDGRIRKLAAARRAEVNASDQEKQDKENHRAETLAKLNGEVLGPSTTEVDAKQGRRGAGYFPDFPLKAGFQERDRERGGDRSAADDSKRMARDETLKYLEGKVDATRFASEKKPVIVDTSKPGQPRPRRIDIAKDKVTNRNEHSSFPRHLNTRTRDGR